MTVEPQTARQLPFSRRNWRLFLLGLGSIILGYVVLSVPPATGFLSLTLAPALLVGGYCVLIPLSILLKDADSSG